MQFSANLGFLWTDRALTDAIYAAKAAGFAAVECHWPYDSDPDELKGALEATGLPLLGLNTARGDIAAGENGLSALPGREKDARAAINQALSYAIHLNASAIHVMAGCAEGPAAEAAFKNALIYACDRSAVHGITILIEPLNAKDAPGYFLKDTRQATEIIAALNRPNLKLMFDCYHVALTEGDAIERFDACLARIGHIQMASVPDRAAPDQGDLDYRVLLSHIADRGWDRPIGAEYRPEGPTDATLGWMKDFAGL